MPGEFRCVATMSVEISTLMLPPFSHLFTENIFRNLDLKDLFHFQAINRQAYQLVNRYLEICDRIDLSAFAFRFDWIHFQLLITRFTHLQCLSLANCKWIDEKQFCNIILHFEHLVELDLSSCHQVSTHMLTSIAEHCVHLRRLSLQACHQLNHDSLSLIADKCPQLKYLDISNCWFLGDNALIDMMMKLSNRLVVLKMSNLYSLTDVSMLALSMYCTNLTHLDISGCWRLTDKSIE